MRTKIGEQLMKKRNQTPQCYLLPFQVTPYTKVLFRVYDHSAFKKDSLVGECVIELYGILVKHDGRLQSLTLSLDLKNTGNEGGRKDSGHKTSSSQSSLMSDSNSDSSKLNNNNNVHPKSGELVIILVSKGSTLI